MLRELNAALRSLPRRSWLVFCLAFAAIFIIFLWHLGNLTPGMSRPEIDYAKSFASFSRVVDNPLNAPHKLVQLAIHKAIPQHPSLLRLPSVLFAVLLCVAFYKLSKAWFGRAIGLFATLIFASLPLLVVSARQATPTILFFAPLVLIAIYAWLVKPSSNKNWAWLSLCLTASVLIFTPGVLMWLVVAAAICHKTILKTLGGISKSVLGLSGLLLVVSLTCLTVAMIHDTSLTRAFFLVPSSLPNWLDLLKHFGWMAASLFVRTGHADPLIVGRMPLLSILLAALLVFGVYAMLGAARKKSLVLGLGIFYAILLAGINDDIELLAFALPALAIFIAAGLRYLYIEWRGVFPRNPVPKTFALVLIAFVAATQVYFGLRYSLSAWPNTPQTRTAYVLK